MEITLTQYLIICPFVFLAGFVDAVAGGGGLIALPAYIMGGLPIHYVIGTSKFSSSLGTALATWKFAQSGYVPWRAALCGAACALVGSAIGANIALRVDPVWFKTIILVVLPLTAGYVLFRKSIESDKPPYGPARTNAISMFCGLTMGVYDGFYGPGTGTFLLLLLTGIAHMKITEANGVAKVVNLATNIAALTVFILHGTVALTLGLVAGAFNIAGSWLGTIYFKKYGAGGVKYIILVVLVIFFAKEIFA